MISDCMKNKITYIFSSGKNPKFVYYGINLLRQLIPSAFFRMRRKRKIAKLIASRSDMDYIESRVNYYNKLNAPVQLPADAPILADHKMPKKKKVYFFDSFEYTRWFPKEVHWGYLPGDIIIVPDYPSIVKSRPLVTGDQRLSIDNTNSIIMKLEKDRHFVFVNDTKPFHEKMNRVIFRGKVKGKPSRRVLMQMYFNHPMCDLGDVSKHTDDPQEWQTAKMTLKEHLDFKFILSMEGNDVASNLKWVMSSNSIAVMPRPTCETWFMEGTLIPNYHYIEIKDDLSDLEERLNYYIEHEDEALEIIKHAHEYVAFFKDKQREDLINLLVLQKYFEKTGQLPG